MFILDGPSISISLFCQSRHCFSIVFFSLVHGTRFVAVGALDGRVGVMDVETQARGLGVMVVPALGRVTRHVVV